MSTYLRAASAARFTLALRAKYGVARLVYFEQFGEVGAAIHREKQLKRWNRAWKIRLIEEKNPNWNDLYPSIAIPSGYWMPAFAGMTSVVWDGGRPAASG
jgi:putative endonuclease